MSSPSPVSQASSSSPPSHARDVETCTSIASAPSTSIEGADVIADAALAAATSPAPAPALAATPPPPAPPPRLHLVKHEPYAAFLHRDPHPRWLARLRTCTLLALLTDATLLACSIRVLAASYAFFSTFSAYGSLLLATIGGLVHAALRLALAPDRLERRFPIRALHATLALCTAAAFVQLALVLTLYTLTPDQYEAAAAAHEQQQQQQQQQHAHDTAQLARTSYFAPLGILGVARLVCALPLLWHVYRLRARWMQREAIVEHALHEQAELDRRLEHRRAESAAWASRQAREDGGDARRGERQRRRKWRRYEANAAAHGEEEEEGAADEDNDDRVHVAAVPYRARAVSATSGDGGASTSASAAGASSSASAATAATASRPSSASANESRPLLLLSSNAMRRNQQQQQQQQQQQPRPPQQHKKHRKQGKRAVDGFPRLREDASVSSLPKATSTATMVELAPTLAHAPGAPLPRRALPTSAATLSSSSSSSHAIIAAVLSSSSRVATMSNPTNPAHAPAATDQLPDPHALHVDSIPLHFDD